jgi:hypothetical protein
MLGQDKCWKTTAATRLTLIFSRICADTLPAH